MIEDLGRGIAVSPGLALTSDCVVVVAEPGSAETGRRRGIDALVSGCIQDVVLVCITEGDDLTDTSLTVVPLSSACACCLRVRAS